MVSRNIARAVVPCLCFRVFPTTFICSVAYSSTLFVLNKNVSMGLGNKNVRNENKKIISSHCII